MEAKELRDMSVDDLMQKRAELREEVGQLNATQPGQDARGGNPRGVVVGGSGHSRPLSPHNAAVALRAH